jgi:hypothetical protein
MEAEGLFKWTMIAFIILGAYALYGLCSGLWSVVLGLRSI